MLNNPINKDKYPNVFDGYQYALDVIGGKIDACVYVKGACNRFIKDYAKPDWDYFFCHDRAEDYLKKVQRFKHVIGDWSTPENPDNRILYLPWQKFVWMNIIGFRWKKNPNHPRFRQAHVDIPRGNGKSAMASQACNYFVGLIKPLLGNTISCFATKSDQARIVLDSARAMALKSPDFLKKTGVVVQAHKIVHGPSNSLVRAMSSESNGLDGLNDTLAVMDELHAMSRSLYDVVVSGMSKRRDSLILCITTAGFDEDSVGYTQCQYAKQVCTGEVEDEQFFAIVYTIDRDDDIYDEKTWVKANPSWGESVDPVTFRAKAMKAQKVPADLPNFKVKHLNIWTTEATSFFSIDDWDKCADPSISIEDFKGYPCRIGMDLSSKIDLTALGYVFAKDDKIYIFDKTFIPEKRVEETRSDIYKNCVEQGYLLTTKGNAINYRHIKNQILQSAKDFDVEEVLFDPWNAISLSQELEEEGINMIQFRMNTANLSEPTKNLEAMIRDGKIVHNGSPLLRWQLKNVVCKEDNAGNVFPRKTEEKNKIDTIIAIIMAIASHTNNPVKEFAYSTGGIRFI